MEFGTPKHLGHPIAGKFLVARQSNAAGEPTRWSQKRAAAESLPA